MSFASRQIQPWTAAQSTYSSVRYNHHMDVFCQPGTTITLDVFCQPGTTITWMSFTNQVQPPHGCLLPTRYNHHFGCLLPTRYNRHFGCLLPTRYNHHMDVFYQPGTTITWMSLANQVQPSLWMFVVTIDSSILSTSSTWYSHQIGRLL